MCHNAPYDRLSAVCVINTLWLYSHPLFLEPSTLRELWCTSFCQIIHCNPSNRSFVMGRRNEQMPTFCCFRWIFVVSETLLTYTWSKLKFAPDEHTLSLVFHCNPLRFHPCGAKKCCHHCLRNLRIIAFWYLAVSNSIYSVPMWQWWQHVYRKCLMSIQTVNGVWRVVLDCSVGTSDVLVCFRWLDIVKSSKTYPSLTPGQTVFTLDTAIDFHCQSLQAKQANVIVMAETAAGLPSPST